MSSMRPVVVIVGPTAVGKSALALDLARRFGGEIVNADSRQIYRYMDIGTAKPTPEERREIPHHLIDIRDPDEEFNLAIFLELAGRSVEDILRRGKIPFLVGGTGLYVRAFVEGWRPPKVPPDPEFRRKLSERAQKEGPEALYRELERLDPDAAAKIDPRNVRRVIRALEVIKATGKPFSKAYEKSPPPFDLLILGLHAPRKKLYELIDRRVDRMIERGFVDEVRRLLEMGYGLHLPSMSSLGYREIGLYLQGKLKLEEAVRKIKAETHRFARHQYAWFRLDDERICWFNVEEADFGERAAGKVGEFLKR